MFVNVFFAAGCEDAIDDVPSANLSTTGRSDFFVAGSTVVGCLHKWVDDGDWHLSTCVPWTSDPAELLSQLIDGIAASVPPARDMEANGQAVESFYRSKLGHWYPTAGVPRNELETLNGVALWSITNVFVDAAVDMCASLLEKVCHHEYDAGVCRVALVGPSGCGKTYVLRHLARAADAATGRSVVKTVIDMDFSGTKDGGIADPGVCALVESVRALGLREPESVEQNQRNLDAVRPLVHRFLVSRLVLLRALERAAHVPGTAAAHYLAQRTTWGRGLCCEVFATLGKWSASDASAVLALMTKGRKGGEIVLGLDEAGVAAVDFFPQLFKSRGDLSVSRGLLGPILASAPPTMAVVVAGTTLRLPALAALGSALKRDQVHTLSRFPTMTREQSRAVLQQLLNLGEAVDAVADLLCGKGRYLEFLFHELRDSTEPPGDSKGLLEVAQRVRCDLVLRCVDKLDLALKTGVVRAHGCGEGGALGSPLHTLSSLSLSLSPCS